MLVRHYSDIHNEFMLGGIHPKDWKNYFYHIPHLPNDKDTILILNGDIDTKGNRIAAYLDLLAPRFKLVIMVCGNHELYYGMRADRVDELIMQYVTNQNVIVAANVPKLVTIDNVDFILATGWTALPTVKDQNDAEDVMNDYRYGKIGEYSRLKPEHTNAFNESLGSFIKNYFDNKTTKNVSVLVNHHVPHSDLATFSSGRYNDQYQKFYYNFSGLVAEYWNNFDHVFFGHIHDNGANMQSYHNTVCHVNCVGYPQQPKTETHAAIDL